MECPVSCFFLGRDKGRVAQSRKHEANLASALYMGVFARQIKGKARIPPLRFRKVGEFTI
jgi:hypothetical protein